MTEIMEESKLINKQIEKYRPYLHFAPKENWLNDPNGLIYFKGEYHLFFQHNPYDDVWGPMHWGHAVSKDLISWEELDIALYPDELGTIFSGSAVVDWNNTTGFFPDEPGLVAIFTHHRDGDDNNPAEQTQSLAYSTDNGRTWSKYQGNPVLSHETKIDFRDPKVFWNEDTNNWIMSLATGQSISFYSSSNLIDWQFESEFGHNKGSHDGVWECPDLFKFKVQETGDEKWVLFVSIGDNGQSDMGSRTQYFVGSFDGSVFKEEHEDVRWLDFGKDNYAGVSFSDIPKQDGRRIYLGWMSNWRYANEVPTVGWRSQMTLPRELSLRKIEGKHRVIQMPVRELEHYFERTIDIGKINIDQGDNKKYKVNEPYYELFLEIDQNEENQFDIVLHHTPSMKTTIEVDTKCNSITLNRASSGKIDFSEMFLLEQSLKMDDSDILTLQIIVDTSSIEIFINGGIYAMTSLIFPDQTSQSVTLINKQGKLSINDGYISTPSNKNITY